MGIKLSNNLLAIRSRIRRLPKMVEGVASAQRKRDANELISTFRSGLRDGTLRLEPLKPATVARKAKRGYAAPRSPLYGLGMEGARTYAKSLRAFRTRNGWAVRVVDGRHHESKKSTRALFLIHEYGATFQTRSGRTGRIPARPALAMSYRKVLKDIARRDPVTEMIAAVNQYLLTGGTGKMDRALSLASQSEVKNG